MNFYSSFIILTGYSHLLTLTLLPYTLLNPRAPISSATYYAPPPPTTTLHLTLPERVSSSVNRLALAPARVLQQTRAKWLAAFEQSFWEGVREKDEAAGGEIVSIGFGVTEDLSEGGSGVREHGGGRIPRSPSELSLPSAFSGPTPPLPSSPLLRSSTSARSIHQSTILKPQHHHRTPSAELARDKEEKAWWALLMRTTKREMQLALGSSATPTIGGGVGRGGLLGFGDVDSAVDFGGGEGSSSAAGKGIGGSIGLGLRSGRMRSRSRFG